MLLCDDCNKGYHMYCLSPPLFSIPEGEWYCIYCRQSESSDEERVDMFLQNELDMLEENIRQSGIPARRLRVQRMEVPRILRTRQNERIRAAILRHSVTVNATERKVNRTRTKTTKKNRKRRSRKGGKRSYIVEYDVKNNFNEKFVVKTASRIIQRRRKCKKSKSKISKGNYLTASQRLAEQFGVRSGNESRSYFAKLNSASFSIFGNKNDLGYFPDSDTDNLNSEGMIADINLEGGLQSSLRVASYHHYTPRICKGLSHVRLNNTFDNRCREFNNGDILSNILDLQEHWHNRNSIWDNVQVNQDGSLNILNSILTKANEDNTNNGIHVRIEEKNDRKCLTEIDNSPENGSGVFDQNNKSQAPLPDNVIQAPMFSGGSDDHNSFHSNSRNDDRGSGNYNNQYGDNTNSNYCNNSSQNNESCSNYSYGSSEGNNRSNIGQQSFNLESQSFFYNVNLPPATNPNRNNNPRQPFTPFPLRFNPRNQRLNNPPIMESMNSNSEARNRTAIHHCPDPNSVNLRTVPQQISSNLPSMNDGNELFADLPPPVRGTVFPPSLSSSSIVLSVPPPPTPPVPPVPVMSTTLSSYAFPVFNSGHLKSVDDLTTENSNCPNFSVYSQESQEVAKLATSADIENAIETEKPECKVCY